MHDIFYETYIFLSREKVNVFFSPSLLYISQNQRTMIHSIQKQTMNQYIGDVLAFYVTRKRKEKKTKRKQ